MRVALFGLLLPVVWFAFWVPVIRDVLRRQNRSTAWAPALAAAGPIGAAIAILSPAAGPTGRS